MGISNFFLPFASVRAAQERDINIAIGHNNVNCFSQNRRSYNAQPAPAQLTMYIFYSGEVQKFQKSPTKELAPGLEASVDPEEKPGNARSEHGGLRATGGSRLTACRDKG